MFSLDLTTHFSIFLVIQLVLQLFADHQMPMVNSAFMRRETPVWRSRTWSPVPEYISDLAGSKNDYRFFKIVNIGW